MSVTKELIIARSCNSDPASVFFLDLSGQRLTTLNSSLNACVNLEHLILDGNPLVGTTGIDGAKLTKLAHLSVRFAGLTSLDWIGRLPSLKAVSAQGNLIAAVDDLSDLALCLPSLARLDLCNPDGSEPNPVCADPRYKDAVRRLFPALQVLDGERLLAPQTVSDAVTALLHEFPELLPPKSVAEAGAWARAELGRLAADPPAAAAAGGGAGSPLTAAQADEKLEVLAAPLYDTLAACVSLDKEAEALAMTLEATLSKARANGKQE